MNNVWWSPEVEKKMAQAISDDIDHGIYKFLEVEHKRQMQESGVLWIEDEREEP